MVVRRVTKFGRLACLVTAVLLAGCTAPPDPVTLRPARTAATAPTDGSAGLGPRTSASRLPSATGPVTAPAGPGTALAALQALAVKGRAPKTGYSRAKFGATWSDDVDVDGGHNGCDTRNDVLRRDLTSVVLKPGTQGCVAASGTLRDPYTGRTIAFVRGESTSDAVQIDHVVALSDSWQTGAQQLTPEQRQDLANDPVELLAVDGPTNQGKGDGDAATWLPPDKTFRCVYVARQIAVKARYRLWVTAAEQAAMQAVLAGCPGQILPTSATTDTPVIVRT